MYVVISTVPNETPWVETRDDKGAAEMLANFNRKLFGYTVVVLTLREALRRGLA